MVDIYDKIFNKTGNVVVFVVNKYDMEDARRYIKSKFDDKEYVKHDGHIYTEVNEYFRCDATILYCKEKDVFRDDLGDLMFVFIEDAVEIHVITRASVKIYREYKPEMIDDYLGKQ